MLVVWSFHIKNYKYLYRYKEDCYKFKPLHIILSETSAYANIMMVK